MKKVAIILGSDSDLAIMRPGMEKLNELHIPFTVRVISAHRTPDAALAFAQGAEEAGFGVLIAAAGKAAHLAGFLAANTLLPVIGVPIKASALEGMDALLATVQMPAGIPVATVAIDGGANAAILSAQILALTDKDVKEQLKNMRLTMAEAVRQKDAALSAQYTIEE